MIERRKSRPPVTYTTFQARDLGSDTAEIFKRACREAVERFKAERRDGRERSVGGSAIGLLLKGLLEAATVAETFAVATLAAVLAFRLLAFLLPAVFVGYTSSLSSQSSSSSSISALASFGPRLGRLGRLGSTRRAE